MAIELLHASDSIKHEYHHDLESLFYVLCYICCICAGSGGVLRKDFDIFQTNVGNWCGKNNQSVADIGRAKCEMVCTQAAFNRDVLPVIHDYFEPLKDCLRKLRTYAVPPDDSAVEEYIMARGLSGNDELPLRLQDMYDRKAQAHLHFAEYKKILREAFDSLPDHDPACETAASTQVEANASATTATHPTASPQIHPPQKDNILQAAEDVPPRLIDLAGPEPEENVDKSATAVSYGSENAIRGENKVAEASNTVVGSGRPVLGKRKMNTFQENEEVNNNEIPKTPMPSGRPRKRHAT